MSDEIVFGGYDNPNTITASKTVDGTTTVYDFSTVTRMVVEFEGSDIVADTDVDATLIDWSAGSGVIEFNFNDLSIDNGTYRATLIAYDPVHASGQVIFHYKINDLRFRFI